MTCRTAFEVEIEDLLLDPKSSEYQELVRHCASCEPCASELEMQRTLLQQLRGETPEPEWHPTDADLLRLHSDSASLEPGAAAQTTAHLSSCAECHDAFEAFRILAATRATVADTAVEGERSPLGLFERIAAAVSGARERLSLAPTSLVGALAAAAIVIMVVSNRTDVVPGQDSGSRIGSTAPIGVLPHAPEFRSPTPAPEALPRKGAAAAIEPLEILLRTMVASRVSSDALAHDAAITARLVLPDTLALGSNAYVRFSTSDGNKVESATLPVLGTDRRYVDIALRPGWLAAGSYEIQISSLDADAGSTERYTLVVD